VSTVWNTEGRAERKYREFVKVGIDAPSPWEHVQGRPILGSEEFLEAVLPEDGWIRLSVGEGTKGPRWYDWRWLPLAAPLEPGWCRWLPIRRSASEPTDVAAYVVFAPGDTPLEEVVRVAVRRWTIESCFEAAKSEVGPDHDEVRSWTGWYRHITSAMWALALLTVPRAGAIADEHC
jgi:hypothetical protein